MLENIGPVLWLIIIGAFFYLMMKGGGCCGGGGHGRGGDAGKESSGHEHGKVPDTERKDEKAEHKHKGGCC